MPDQPYGLGAIPSPPDERDAAYHVSTLAAVATTPMPGKVPGSIPYPLNQGDTGTCVAQAVVGAAMVVYRQKFGKWPPFNESTAQTLYLEATGDRTLKVGTYPRLVLDFAYRTGILGTDGKRYKIASYNTLLPSADPQAAIERTIGVLGLPVIFAINWPSKWMGKGSTYLPNVSPGDPSEGGHAFYGFRYAMKHPVPGSSKVSQVDDGIMNSWSKAFGNGGWAWASGASLTGRAFDLWTITF